MEQSNNTRKKRERDDVHIITTQEEAEKAFHDEGILHTFIRYVLPRINPFLAMRLFKQVPRIMAALATDGPTLRSESDGYLLWKAYLIHFRLAYQIRPDLNAKAKMNAIDEAFPSSLDYPDMQKFKDQFHEVLTVDGLFPWERPRHIFMWMFLRNRVLLRKYAQKISNPRVKSEMMKDILPLTRYEMMSPEEFDGTFGLKMIIDAQENGRIELLKPVNVRNQGEFFVHTFTRAEQEELYPKIKHIETLIFLSTVFGRIRDLSVEETLGFFEKAWAYANKRPFLHLYPKTPTLHLSFLDYWMEKQIPEISFPMADELHLKLRKDSLGVHDALEESKRIIATSYPQSPHGDAGIFLGEFLH